MTDVIDKERIDGRRLIGSPFFRARILNLEDVAEADLASVRQKDTSDLAQMEQLNRTNSKNEGLYRIV